MGRDMKQSTARGARFFDMSHPMALTHLVAEVEKAGRMLSKKGTRRMRGVKVSAKGNPKRRPRRA